MTKLRRRALSWLLTGTAFLTVIMSSGCVQTVSKHSSSQLPVAAQFSGAPAVNSFGELRSMPCHTSARIVTESGLIQHTFIEDGYDADVAVSPDGQYLVYSSTRHRERADLYLQRTDGLSVIQLTDDEAIDAFPAFSPDGKQIAFSSTRSGNWDIYFMDPSGRNVVQLTNSPAQELHPSFSPDGRRLVYCAQNRSGQWELWTVDLRTQQKRMVGQGLFPDWSPDRSRDRIAFQRARARGSRWFTLWTMDLLDGEPTNVTEVAVSTNAAIVSPSWSPDGKRLAFATVVEPADTTAGKPLGQQDIWIIDADGANRRRLTDGRGSNAAPFWAVDDRVYFISDRSGSECVWSASARIDAKQPITASKPHAPVEKDEQFDMAGIRETDH